MFNFILLLSILVLLLGIGLGICFFFMSERQWLFDLSVSLVMIGLIFIMVSVLGLAAITVFGGV